MRRIEINFSRGPKIHPVFKIVITAFAVLISSYILPGIHVDNFLTALWAALAITALNFLVRPVLIILTIPLTIFSFGLFLLVINAFIILITDKLIKGFMVDGFWTAFLFSIAMSIIIWLLELPEKLKRKKQEQQQNPEKDNDDFDHYEEIE